MHAVAPRTQPKRRYSDISMPRPSAGHSSSSSSHSSHGPHHPLNHFMNIFHRGARGRPARQQPPHQDQVHQQARPTKPQAHHHEQPHVHFGQPTRPTQPAKQGGSMTYVPPNLHGGMHAGTVATAAAKPSVLTAADQTGRPSGSSSHSTASAAQSANAAAEWRKASCPRSGKPYYWNVRTRESRWKKPLELASEEEREAIRSKEASQRAFFDSMERNILRRLEDGQRQRAAAAAAKMAGDAATEAAEGAHRGAALAHEVTASPGGDLPSATGGIDQSWIQAGAASPNDTSGGADDWIAGWITPGSGGDPARSPTGSLSSTEGLSVVTPGSAGSGLSREERDDKLQPLHKPNRIERIKSATKVVNKLDLIRTISKMEYDLVHQLNPALGKAKHAAKVHGRPSHVTRDVSPETLSPGSTGTCGMDLVPLTPTTQTCDILSSLRLTLGADGLDVSLDSLLPGSAVPVTPTSPMTPATLEPSTPGNDGSPNERSMSSPHTTSAEPSPREGVAKPSLTKRNTCGTIYLGTTLSAPDKDALIKCVCGVYRAHLLQQTGAHDVTASAYDAHTNSRGGFNGYHSHLDGNGREDPHHVFHDRRAPGDYRSLDTTSIPTLSQITDFYRSIFLRSQMEVDCIIISLIYVERLIKLTRGALKPRPNNWRSVLFSCMVLASKVWDDLSMWNCDFSKIGPSGVTFSLARTNELEIALLRALEYRVKVGASEYAKYYFLLRGMLCRSGLANDDLTKMQPLDVQGARTLEGLDVARTLDAGASSPGDKGKSMPVGELKERSKSYGDMESNVSSEAGKFQDDGSGGAFATAGAAPPQPSPRSSPASKRVSLEQIVRM